MRLKLANFSGIAPKIAAANLPDNMAVIADNCRLDSGSIKPLQGISANSSLPAGTNSAFFYKAGGQVLAWPQVGIDVVLSPIANDSHHRLYYTGEGDEAKYTAPDYRNGHNANGFVLGIPAPQVTPTATFKPAASPTISPPDMVQGNNYTIVSLGNTDFSLWGDSATNIAVGDTFTMIPKPINAGAMVDGQTYTIYTVGTQGFAWDAVGAPANYAVGTTFVCHNTTGQPLATGSDAQCTNPKAPSTGTVSLNQATTSSIRYYVYTYVSPLGEEGAPSQPSPAVIVDSTYSSSSPVTITFTSEQNPQYNLGAGSKRRLYRTAQGTTSTQYEFVADIDIGTLTYQDSKVDTQLGEILPSANWSPAPDPLKGLKVTPNGFLVGFYGNTLCVSEQFMPHAWDANNELAFPDDITALSCTGDSIIVFTKRYPYLVTGSSPSRLTAIKVDYQATCTNKQSIVDMGGYIIFASPDGLMTVSANQITNITKDYITKDQWQSYQPNTMRGFYYGGIYLCCSDTFTFMFDTRFEKPIITTITGLSFLCGYNDFEYDALYLLDANANIIKWEADKNALSATWTSKLVRLERPVCPAAVKIFASGDVDFKLFGDGQLISDMTIKKSGTPIRLPSGYRAKEFQIQLSGTSVIDSVEIVTSMSDFSNGN